MAMKVYKEDDRHYETHLHAVRKLDYKQGTRNMIDPVVVTWCGKKNKLRDEDLYTQFIKKEHKEDICQGCKEAISIHNRRKERAYHAS